MAKEKPRELTPLLEAKRWLRRYLVRRRQAISAAERRRWSRQAAENLIRSSYYKKADVVAAFVGFGSEIDTRYLINDAWKRGKKVVIPATADGFHRPFFAIFHKNDRLTVTPHGPFEHAERKNSFPFSSIDLVVLPGLGYDSNGFRLGYGGGVYDRFLEKTPRATHIGLFFSNQFVPVIPREKHDRKMHAIVTEKRILR